MTSQRELHEADKTMIIDHSEITRVITDNGRVKYGVGIKDNPYADEQLELSRRVKHADTIAAITEKIRMLQEPRFITVIEIAECIAALITMTDSRKILELGVCTGHTTLHMLRAIIGKEGAKVTTVDFQPECDMEFFARPDIAPWFELVVGRTPEILNTLSGRVFEVCFVDSSHDKENTMAEVGALWGITKPGSIFLFHDCPAEMTPDNPNPPPVRLWLEDMVKIGKFKGLCLPSCEQADCLAVWGKGYNTACSPGLGVFIRQ